MISKVVCMLMTDVKTHLLTKCEPLRIEAKNEVFSKKSQNYPK